MALAIGVVCLAIILGLRYWLPRVHGILIAVVGSTMVSVVLDLSARPASRSSGRFLSVCRR